MSYKRYSLSCLLCKTEVSNSGFGNHYNSKLCNSGNGLFKPKLINCPYCNIFLDGSFNEGNHVRWCEKRPTTKPTIKYKTCIVCNIKFIKSRRKTCSDKCANFISIDTRTKMSIGSQKSKHQRICKSTHEFVDKLGRKFMFDSSWEDLVAIQLDKLNVRWIRPEPIQYTKESGKVGNYFADFYLPDFGMYVDPKNSYVRETQKYKLAELHKIIKLVIPTTKEECTNFDPRLINI